MAVYYADSINQNNAESVSAVSVKNISFDDGGELGLANGDIITLGSLPLKSITTDLKVLVTEEFDGDTPQFIVGQYNRQTGAFADITETIVLTGSGQALFRVNLSPGDFPNLAPDGTAFAGEFNAITNDDQTAIAIKWIGGATAPTKGDMRLIFHTDYYGVTNGKYGCDNTPLTVYGPR